MRVHLLGVLGSGGKLSESEAEQKSTLLASSLEAINQLTEKATECGV